MGTGAYYIIRRVYEARAITSLMVRGNNLIIVSTVPVARPTYYTINARRLS